VIYLPTDLPDLRTKAVLPVDLIDENDDNPYYPDAVEKYFARPQDHLFSDITYPDYFRYYNISPKKNKSNSFVQMLGSTAVDLLSSFDINMFASKTPRDSFTSNFYFKSLPVPRMIF
jgi:hypothetical protein